MMSEMTIPNSNTILHYSKFNNIDKKKNNNVLLTQNQLCRWTYDLMATHKAHPLMDLHFKLKKKKQF